MTFEPNITNVSKDAKALSIIRFARHLRSQLIADHPTDSQLTARLATYLAALPLRNADVPQSCRSDIRKCAIELWNSYKNVDVDVATANLETRKTKAKVWAFAYFMLDSVTRKSHKEFEFDTEHQPATAKDMSMTTADLKHFHTGVEAARSCIDVMDVELAIKVIGVVAERYEKAVEGSRKLQEGSDEQIGLAIEYSCLRMALEWKRHRLDLADNWYRKLFEISGSSGLPSSTKPKLLDLMYEIGSDELDNKKYEGARKWLHRAKELVGTSPNAETDMGSDELRLNVLHAYVRASFGLLASEYDEEMIAAMAVLRRDYGNKLAVMLLRIETLGSDSGKNTDQFRSEFLHMIKSVHMIESNHKMSVSFMRDALSLLTYTGFRVLQCIHKLSKLNIDYALDCMCQYIVQRLVQHCNDDWIQATIVTCIWIATSESHFQDSFNVIALNELLDSVSSAWSRGLNEDAAHAAHTLLWRRIGQLTSTTQIKDWCSVGLHTIFGRSGDMNVGKMERKLISCHMTLADYEAARKVLEQMSTYRRSHHLTRYLNFCLASQTNHQQEAQSILASMLASPKRSNKILFACVGQIDKHGTGADSVRLLQRLLDKYIDSPPAEVNIVILLRSVANLLFSVLEKSQMPEDEALSRLCNVFKTVTRLIRPPNLSKRSCDLSVSAIDCRWFENFGYNLAIEHIHSWPPKYTLDLLEYSTQIDHSGEGLVENTYVVRQEKARKITIPFIQTLVYMSMVHKFQPSWTLESIPRTAYDPRAKPPPNEVKQTLCRNVFDRYIKMKQYYDQKDQVVGNEEEDLRGKICTILPLAFEALLFLTLSVDDETSPRMVDELSLFQLIDQAGALNVPSKVLAIIADVVLRNATIERSESNNGCLELSLVSATNLLGKIIQSLRKCNEYSLDQAARWVRCIVQLTVDCDQNYSYKTDTDTKLKLLEPLVGQALQLARSASSTNLVETEVEQARLGEDVDMSGTQDENRKIASDMIPLRYPPEELEYLATILFNLAIDLYVEEKEDEAKEWTRKAIEVADAIIISNSESSTKIKKTESNGTLAHVLRQKADTLGWLL